MVTQWESRSKDSGLESSPGLLERHSLLSHRLDFRRSLVSGADSFPERQMVIELGYIMTLTVHLTTPECNCRETSTCDRLALILLYSETEN